MKVLVTGDFCPQFRLTEALLSKSPDQVFGDFTAVIRSVDVAITNLECPITDSSNVIVKTGPTLKAPEETSAFIREAGFNLLALANNHIMDFGPQGLHDTMSSLRAHRIAFLGAGRDSRDAGRVYFAEQKGVKAAFLNFAENEWSTTHGRKPGANPIDTVNNFRAIQEVRGKADKVIVIAHGGHERYRLPSPRMKQLFRFYVEAGATAVINHHTHCTSGFEVYQGAPIFYSLGNFLFDHPNHRNSFWNKGMAVVMDLSGDHCSFELLHFDQCGERPELTLCSSEESEVRSQELDRLNEVIQSDEELRTAFENWVISQARLYNAYIEPHDNRYFQVLQFRKWLPSLWSRRKKQFLLNLVRCESHRDALQALLEDEVTRS